MNVTLIFSQQFESLLPYERYVTSHIKPIWVSRRKKKDNLSRQLINFLMGFLEKKKDAEKILSPQNPSKGWR